MTSAQSGLLHTWGHLYKTMKRRLRRSWEPDSEAAQHFQDMHLALFYRQMWDRASYTASALKIRFMSRYDDRLPFVILGNAALLRRAVAMLLDYAMDRHPGVGYTTFEVDLTEEDDREYVSFVVWRAGVRSGGDDGARTWFSQSEMDQLVALMGAYFLTEDQHGMEPRYTIRIPLFPGDPSIVTQVPLSVLTAKVVQAKRSTTALVVDDSPVSRALGVYLLSRHNIAADVAENGHVALEMLTDKYYDLVFMDYSMPGLDGMQTTALIRARGHALSQASCIIGMSSNVDMEAAFFTVGMQRYLAKPVDPLNLNLLLRDMLPRLRRQPAQTPEQYTAGFYPAQAEEDVAIHAEENAPDQIAGEQGDLIRRLSGIPGLDAEKGLVNAGGSVEIYAGMLRRFTFELSDYIDPLLSLPVDGSWEEVAIRLLVLREFFVGIGAEDLAQEAAALAAAAEAGGGDECMLRIQSHCDAMMRLRASLVALKDGHRHKLAADGRRKQKRTRPEMEPVVFRQQVERLHDACLSHRVSEAQAMADELRRMHMGEDIEEQIEAICALVDTLDYHEARERCAYLLERLGPWNSQA
ncbi:MAG: response regulator [Betaproteobacteria bacterium]|nr:response regulator [Betaproteobacteria bacterium]